MSIAVLTLPTNKTNWKTQPLSIEPVYSISEDIAAQENPIKASIVLENSATFSISHGKLLLSFLQEF
jgi:uncharacterized protein YrrD